MSSSQKIKQGYMRKYGKAVLVDQWKKVFVELDGTGTLYWYKKKKSKASGYVTLAKICEYFTIGSYCRAIPFSPYVPSDGRLENMFAFPEKPNKKSKIHFFLCDSDYDFNQWMSVIVSFFPTAPVVNNPQQPVMPMSHSPYSPSPVSQFPVTQPPSAAPNYNQRGPLLGFEGLTISGNYAPQQPGYPPQQAGHSPYPSHSSTYPYQPPSYPQQPAAYPQQQPAAYPQQQQSYYPTQPNCYPSQPAYNTCQTSSYLPQQPTYPYTQPGYGTIGAVGGCPTYIQQPPQTILVKGSRNPGLGKVAAGVLGGAVAGYAASRMFGGWGFGRGWGRGSWGSWSWSSGSWGSFSGCSWGSFG